jgi:hypothetical protein
MPWATRRFNRSLAAALAGGLLLLWLLVAGGAAIDPIALLFMAIFWLYLVCIALLIEWAVLWRRGRHPELPFGPPAWSGQRWTLRVLAGFVALVTLLREGAFAPDLTYDINLQTSRRAVTQNTTTSASSTAMDGAVQPRLAETRVQCLVSCSPNTAMCQAFTRRFRCDDPDPTSTAPLAILSGTVSFGAEPFCYTPLYKSGRVPVTAMLTLGVATPGANANHSISLTGDIAQTMTGVGSCYTFHRQLGEQGAELLAQALNHYIQAN